MEVGEITSSEPLTMSPDSNRIPARLRSPPITGGGRSPKLGMSITFSVASEDVTPSEKWIGYAPKSGLFG